MQGEKEAQNIADVRSTHFKLHAKNRLKIIRRTCIESWLATSCFPTNKTWIPRLQKTTLQLASLYAVISIILPRNMTQIARSFQSLHNAIWRRLQS